MSYRRRQRLHVDTATAESKDHLVLFAFTSLLYSTSIIRVTTFSDFCHMPVASSAAPSAVDAGALNPFPYSPCLNTLKFCCYSMPLDNDEVIYQFELFLLTVFFSD